MATNVANARAAAHPVLPETPSHMAKANLRKAEKPDVRAQVGAAIQRAASLVGWSLKELAGHLERDPRQVARWIDGSERPHFDVLFAIEELRQPLVVAIAEELGGEAVEIETVMRARRLA